MVCQISWFVYALKTQKDLHNWACIDSMYKPLQSLFLNNLLIAHSVVSGGIWIYNTDGVENGNRFNNWANPSVAVFCFIFQL